ncbi:hypothetical protein IAQ67_29130 (plasmid) [Paenibacillus peoriae]|uniref:Uncharacterized protein n=1 Tax=Paenibacillus peoriae TaxID=59893 RepID=A0A7H0YH60_9BACL|nr:hypothetical protein [Paenibacillus peoriae]QNR70418.1 hypothetical protein IAQ67_29130 [Paenibacillus peoriae]
MAVTNLEATPALAWAADKAIKIRLADDSLANTATPTVTVLEQGSNPANSIDVTLTYNASTTHFEGTVHLTNNSASTKTPKLVLNKNATIQFLYTDSGGTQEIASVSYTLKQPESNGYYVEVRSSVRNLHWDLTTILTKAGWKFVETLPPLVDNNGYVTQFTHVLKTVTTPTTDETGQAIFSEMFLILKHADYPGDNKGNFKRITFQLTPNYYYYDVNKQGMAPDTRQNDVLYALNGLNKLAEYPTYPVNVDFVADAVSSAIPNVLDIPVNIWGYASRDHFSFVFQGEPSLTNDGYGMVSHVYCGQIDSFKEGKIDVGGNFALTGSSENAVAGQRYGEQTSDGVSSISMYRTYGGLLWQNHYASVIYDDPQGESRKSELYQPSSWTGKFHLSPVYVYHTTDGKRGFLRETLAVNKQGILHLDELEIIKPVSDCNPCPVDTNGDKIDPNDIDHPEYDKAWKREKYKYYRLTSSHHFLKSFGVKDKYSGIGIAIKMEAADEKVIRFNTSYDIVTGRGVSSWTGIGAVPEGAELAGARTESISAGTIMLQSGGQPSVEPTFTGEFTKAQVINDSSGVPYAVTVELLVNEDPAATSEIGVSAKSLDGSTSLGEIKFSAFRAGELDNITSNKFGFRGTFYLTKTGTTDDMNDMLKFSTNGRLEIKYQTLAAKMVSL